MISDILLVSSHYFLDIRAVARKPRPRPIGSAQSISSISLIFTYVIEASVWWCLTQTASKNIEPLIFYWIFTESPKIHDREISAHCCDYISRTAQQIELKLCVDIHIGWLYHQKKFQLKWSCCSFSADTPWKGKNAYFGPLYDPISDDQ